MNKLFEAFQHNQRRTSLAAQILVLLMMMCVNIICVMTAGWMSSNFNSQGVIIFGLLVIVEAFSSCHILRNRPVGDDRKPYYLLAQWIVIFLAVKIFTEIRFGFDYLVQNLITWPNSFAESFFTTNFLFNALITLILWLFTTLFIRDLLKFEDDINEIQGYLINEENNHKSASASLRERFFAIGALVVFFAGIMRQSKFTMSGRIPASEVVVSLVVAYFLLGMVLLSLAHFSNLRASWGYEQFSIHKNMASRWLLYFFLFLVCLGLIVFFLPTNYSMGLFTTIRFIFDWLFNLLKFLMILILFPFFWIFNLISRLLGKPAIGPGPSGVPPRVQQPEQGLSINLPGWEILKSVIFWLVFLAMIIFAVRQYIHANRRLFDSLRHSGIIRWISAAWTWIARQFREAGNGIGAILEAGVNRLRIKRLSVKRLERWHYLNPNRMTPKERIIFFYLSMLRRAGEAGTTRKSWETPMEFSRKLRLAIPEEKETVTYITNTFMDARYSPREMTPDQADKIRVIWVRLTGIFRRKSKQEKQS